MHKGPAPIIALENAARHPALVVTVIIVAAACQSTPPATSGSGQPAASREAPAEAAEQEVFQNTIRWSTASEIDNFGYDVWRSESADGPFERLNPEIIEGAGTSDEPTHYSYIDATIDPYTTYFYYVEAVSMAGVRERFTPIGRAAPKLPPPAIGDDE